MRQEVSGSIRLTSGKCRVSFHGIENAAWRSISCGVVPTPTAAKTQCRQDSVSEYCPQLTESVGISPPHVKVQILVYLTCAHTQIRTSRTVTEHRKSPYWLRKRMRTEIKGNQPLPPRSFDYSRTLRVHYCQSTLASIHSTPFTGSRVKCKTARYDSVRSTCFNNL